MEKKVLGYLLLILVLLSGFVHGAIPAQERAALIALYNSTNGDSWTNNSGWKTPPLDTDGFAMPGTEGTWYGITVSGERVTQIILSSNQLSGSIPPQLGNLANLLYLWISSNDLSGSSIPPELGNLTNLTYLNLYYNHLSGSIPPKLGNLANLTQLVLSYNQLSGSIPPELENLANLTHLDLRRNQLSGSIPPELGNLASLTSLGLYHNQLSGSIPPELENLANLIDLYLSDNQLSGSIPPELGNLTNLLYLSIASNQLSGSIPPELGNLANLTGLTINNNQLSGSIPPELGNLANLTSLSISYNQLSGSIPPELGNLANLSYLYLANNQLSGSIPPELGNLENLRYLFIRWNQLSGNIPLEFGNLTNLVYLYLNNNKLSGAIPTDLTNLTKLSSPFVDIGYNCLYSNDSGLRAWLNSVDPDWEDNQDECDTTPTVTTNTITLITANSAVSGGNVTSDGGATVTARGMCWSTSSNPTTTDSKTIDGSGTGSFTSNITGLSSNTKYYVRAYATNSEGTAYGNERNFTTLPLTTTYTLYVQSTPETGVNITVSPNDNNNYGNGSTNFTRTYNQGTQVTLTAPSIFNGKSFLKWVVDNVDKTGRTTAVTMDSDHTAQAVYQASTYTLTVQSSPDSGASIFVSPNDNNGQGNGSTQFFRTYDYGTIVNLTAPASHNGKNFVKWLIDGTENTDRTIQVNMDSNHTAQAVYQSPTYTMTVQSSPNPGVGITVNPNDNNGNGNGNTNFTRTYNSGTIVTLTAPPSNNGSSFIKWTVDGKDYSTRTIQLTMDSNHTAAAYYETSRPPEISVNRTSLNFGYIVGSSNIPKETFIVYNRGGGTLNWGVSCELWRVTLSPVSGTNCGIVEVEFYADGLLPQKCKKDAIYVSDPLVSNSPVEVKINLWVKEQSESSPPFGEFATPINGSTVYSSIPVTGWVLGDTGIENVKIYREQGSSLVYIGDAVFVEGARPDVEAAYPDYPMNYKAVWGYMMLTNFLPNGGNGTYKIHAIATDKEGRQTTLGIKTIICDNANAEKPFGAIDTPTQGGTASGNNFINWGWVLTPPPNYIPTDGSTINVIVDGVNIGNPTYNNYRKDIAKLFPGYANSNGAVGYFYLDTTAYEDGMHTIQWTATDSAGNTDGIGSRYFNIQNICASSSSSRSASHYHSSTITNMDQLKNFPIDFGTSVRVKRGYERDEIPQQIFPDNTGTTNIKIRELEQIEIHLSHDTSEIDGFMIIGNQFRALPVGSTLDRKRGIFYWQPGPGFVGDYRFLYIDKKENGEIVRKYIKIKIIPKFKKGEKRE